MRAAHSFARRNRVTLANAKSIFPVRLESVGPVFLHILTGGKNYMDIKKRDFLSLAAGAGAVAGLAAATGKAEAQGRRPSPSGRPIPVGDRSLANSNVQ